jgi:hypothetical protein
MVRLLRGLYMWVGGGTVRSLIVSLVLLLVAAVAFFILMFPALRADPDNPRTVTASDLQDLGTYSTLEVVQIRGELYDSGLRDGDDLRYGMIDAGGTLILVQSASPLSEGSGSYSGTLQTRTPDIIDVQNEIASALNLTGSFAEAYFVLGAPDTVTIVSFYIALAIPTVFGLFGVFRFVQRRVSGVRASDR